MQLERAALSRLCCEASLPARVMLSRDLRRKRQKVHEKHARPARLKTALLLRSIVNAQIKVAPGQRI